MKKQLVVLGTLLAASASMAAIVSAPMVHPAGQGSIIPVTVIENGVRKDVTTDDENYDFNGDTQGWTSHGTGLTNDTWHVEATGPSGMSDVWWSADAGVGGYLSSSFVYMQTPAIDLSAASSASLAFNLFYRTETPGGEPAGYDGWDGCNVWASVDGGTTWNVISGTPAYTATSSFAFGSEFGMGTGIPQWGGTGPGVQAASFNLDSFTGAGNSDVRLRFVMCADPGFDSIDDPLMTGMEVDDIVVTANASTVWSDNGSSNTGGAVEHNYWVFGDDWAYTGTDWVCDDNFNLGCWIGSPNLTGLTPPMRIVLQQDLWCDMPDQDGDDDGILEDYFYIEYSTDGGATWVTACYDYFRAPIDMGYATYTDDDVFNGSLILTLPTETQFQLRYRMRTDDNADGGSGTGLHVDNVVITIAPVPLHDLGVSKAWYDYPRVVGETQLPKVEIRNYGATDETPVRVSYVVYQDSLNGPVVHTATPAHLTATLVPGLSTVRTSMATTDPLAFKWTPLVAGLYTAKFYPNPSIFDWANLDEDHSNDTLVVNLGITDQNVGFLRYDPGNISSAWTLSQNDGEDGALVRFDPFRLDNELPSDPTHIWDPEFLNLSVYAVEAGDQITIVIHDEGDSSSVVGPLLATYTTTIIDENDVYPNIMNRWIGNFPELKCRNTPVWIGVRTNNQNATGVVGLADANGAPAWVNHSYGYDYLTNTTSEWGGDLRFYVQMSWGVEAEIPFTIDLASDLVYNPNAQIALSWNSPGAVDGYAIHASTDPFFVPNGGTLVTTVDQYTTSYTGDASVAGSKLFYKVIGFNGLCQ
ncbi:MAG: immune inhibitor A [Candidatus Delongbacteria bacterium]|nr:immune inhibitor A [Candidatus Delongbacteria bacterium]